MYYWCDILIKVLKVMNQAAYIIGGYNTRHDSFSLQQDGIVIYNSLDFENYNV